MYANEKIASQKGITAVDVIIAIMIILSTFNIVMMIYTNLSLNLKSISKRTIASKIAVNIAENINLIYYDQFKEKLENLSKNSDDNYCVLGGEKANVFDTDIPAGYTVIFKEESNYQTDILKNVEIEVLYNIDSNVKSFTLNQVLKRESIRESNSPNFDEIYLKQLGIEDNNYCFWYSGNNELVADKIICPIKYDICNKKYYAVDISENTNDIWYSYSNNQWASVLVLEKSDIELIDDSGNVDIGLIDNGKLFYWIPRFFIDESNNLYFLFNDTNYAIKNTYYDLIQKDVQYNYIDISNEYKTDMFKDEENVELYGKWISNSDIDIVGNNLNKSKFRNYDNLFGK